MEIHYRRKGINLRMVWRSLSTEFLNVASLSHMTDHNSVLLSNNEDRRITRFDSLRFWQWWTTFSTTQCLSFGD